MCFLMHCYLIRLCILDIFQSSYFYTSTVCDQNIDPVNGISASKAAILSIINVHYFPHFLGSNIFNWNQENEESNGH